MTERDTEDELITKEYGVRVERRVGKYEWESRRYWTPEPTSAEEAPEVVAEQLADDQAYRDVLSDAEDVQSQEVPVPEKWSDEKKEAQAI